MAKSAIGLDIGTRTVHVAELSSGRGGASVENFGGIELPHGAVREGEIVDSEAVSEAIRQLVGSTGIRNKEVLLGVANQRVVVRQIDLPWMEEAELRESLRFQVQEYIPIPVEDAELDFYTLDEFQGEGDVRMSRILLVAAHMEMVGTLIRAATDAGLRPVGVDLNPFAVLRSVGTDSAVDEATEVLVDVGEGVTNIMVHENGVPRFVRVLVLGGGDITDGLASALGVDRDEAERLKKSTGLVEGASEEPARVITERANQFVDEVRSSLDYYQAQMGSARIARVVLTGGGALLRGLPERVSSALRLPVEVGDPFARLDTGKGVKLRGDELQQVAPVLATAIGLALGGVE